MPPLLEFIVMGTPVSAQGKKLNRRKWRQAIKDAVRKVWKQAPTAQKLRSIMIHFHKGDIPPLDNDNMSKGVHDALIREVYADDRQVIDTRAIQVRLEGPMTLDGASPLLLTALARREDFLYFRCDEIPETFVLPT